MTNEMKYSDYVARRREEDNQYYQEECLSTLPTIIEILKSAEKPQSRSDRVCLVTLKGLLKKIKMGSIKAGVEEEWKTRNT